MLLKSNHCQQKMANERLETTILNLRLIWIFFA